MSFEINYNEAVVKEDIPRLSNTDCKKIKRAIEEKLTKYPEQFGKPLRRSLKGYRKLRVGDYRVVFRIDKKLVKVLVIQHRSNVYKLSDKRLTSQ